MQKESFFRRPNSFARAAMLVLFLTAFVSSTTPAQTTSTYDPTTYQAMEWRNIGPFRGGRSVAVAGIPTQKLTYYFGGTGGGVWKTDDAGETWRNVSDGFFKTGSVGAIAVAESDPNVVYVGMGEHAVRGVTTSHGDGVYKSTDAGRTWHHMGLELTRAISRIRVHPGNPDLVYVAAQGAPYGATKERGIYRSSDGGATWELVLKVDETTGASELAMDRTNPRILYAAFWDHLRDPWVVRSGGPGSAIYKSTDGGDSWEKLTEGLPELMGKTAIDVSPADPDRVWALIEADSGGLYRSDDAGKSWTLVNSERVLRARAWYYIEVYADPQDRETVYVLNAPMMRSIDGGKTFTRIQVPHGDNHDLWIHPFDNQIMVNANDGGANVSFNGGKTWSTQQNQPTAQFYRVSTDHQFPFWLYGGQQDNTSVAIMSRSTHGPGIGWKDWFNAGGGESAYVTFDPDNPVLLYATSIHGVITELDTRTKAARSIMASPPITLGLDGVDLKYRFNWNAPVVASPHDPTVIYHAAQMLLKTEDRGRSWTEVSPDLTQNDKEKQGKGGLPFTNETAGGELYNTIFYVAPSPHEEGILWVGTDDGLVKLTRDGGATWTDITPEGIGETTVNAIEVSPHDPAAAYIAVTKYKFNDFTPHILKTTDYGRSWKPIVDGIAADAWVRVVREDPIRRGLLYAGTETGMYVSFDDGEHWQSLQLNLPIVAITDLQIEQNQLVAATQGRAFWILDDLTVLQQLTQEVASSEVHLFRPENPYRVGGGTSDSPTLGKNPPNGAVIYYNLAQEPDGVATLEILDAAGEVLRTFSSDSDASAPLATKTGLNRQVWDLRRESPEALPRIGQFGSEGRGYRSMPGTYTARLTVGDSTLTQGFEVLADPRLEPGVADYRASELFLRKVYDSLVALRESVKQIRSVRDQASALIERTADQPGGDEIGEAGGKLVDSLTAIEERLVQVKRETQQDRVNFPPTLNDMLLGLQGQVDNTDFPPTAGALLRLDELSADWNKEKTELQRLMGEDLEAFNTLIREKGVPAVSMTAR